MPFCASCGSQVEGRFCAKCGATVGAAGPAQAPPPGAGYTPPQQSYTPPPQGYTPPPQGYAPPPAGAVGMTDNVASALCYALTFITGILFLVIEPYNKNRVVRFHAFQAIFLGVGMVIVSIVLGIFDTMLWRLMGFWMAGMFSSLVHLAFLAIWLYMLITTYQGKTTVLPVIGQLAQQQAG